MLYDIIFRVMISLAVNGGILPLTALPAERDPAAFSTAAL